jgi:hypothetical protein
MKEYNGVSRQQDATIFLLLIFLNQLYINMRVKSRQQTQLWCLLTTFNPHINVHTTEMPQLKISSTCFGRCFRPSSGTI